MKNVLILALMSWSLLSGAQIPKPQEDTYVNDFARVLSAGEISILNQQIAAIEKKSGVQIAVVLVKKVPPAYDIADYTLLIGRKWHVGTNKDGIVYVAAIRQHKQRLEVAEGLAQTLPDSLRKSILATIKPFFKQHDYNSGLLTLVDQLGASLNPVVQPVAPPVVQQTDVAGQADTPVANFIYCLIMAGLILPVIYLVSKNKRAARRVSIGYTNDDFNHADRVADHYHDTGHAFVARVASAIIADSLQHSYDHLIEDDQPINGLPDGFSPGTADSQDYGNWGSGSENNYDSGSDYSSSSDDSGFSGDDGSSSDS
jgi:uncharacterized membrane protein YgcG